MRGCPKDESLVFHALSLSVDRAECPGCMHRRKYIYSSKLLLSVNTSIVINFVFKHFVTQL